MSTVAPLTIQDCHVDGWKDPKGAVQLSCPPVLLFDCTFTNPPRDPKGVGLAPVNVPSAGQRLLVSKNRIQGAPGLLQGAQPMLVNIPQGEYGGAVQSAHQVFLSETAQVPTKVFDVRRDFHAKADGRSDDTAAVQNAINAAAATSDGAVAYLPTGSYTIRDTLQISGTNFYVAGSGWSTKLIWNGSSGGTMIEVRDPRQVRIQDMMVGSHDAGPMNNGADILQVGSSNGSRITYDGVYVYGMYQKKPFRKGIWFRNLGEKDVVLMQHVQGNLHFVDCGRSTVLANCSFEGSVVVEGKEQTRGGLLGFQTRLATIVTYGLYLRDNSSLVMSDFYVEQADNGYFFEGGGTEPPGRATLSGAKFHSFSSADPEKNNVLDIRNYRGQIFIGPYQFYQSPKQMRIKQTGTSPVSLDFIACSWYGAAPDPHLGPTAQLEAVGNEEVGKIPEMGASIKGAFFSSVPTAAELSRMSEALDDFRRLGEADLRLNHPEALLGN